jgi:hypothetical protein
MKRLVFPIGYGLVALGAVLAGARVFGAEEKVPAVTLVGTVVDTHCYVTHGIHDASHTACSNACIARGVPAGFLAEDGKLYMLFGEKPFSVKDTVADLADVPVRLTGRLVERGGVRGIQIQSIERIQKK